MGFFKDLFDLDAYDLEDAFRDLFGPRKRTILDDFNEVVIEPIREELNDIKEEIKSSNQRVKNEFKKKCKEISPELGEAVEKLDRTAITIRNHIEASSSRSAKYLRKRVKSINQLKEGDHLFVDGKIGPDIYTHHGLYVGDGYVIHYDNGLVCEVTYEEFASGRKVYVLDSPIIYSRETVVYRARMRLGENKYDLFFNNCEHFVRWCRGSDEWEINRD
ncbi:lecithin retinol acyltransferase family protein [Caloramator sp. CAR-1]|uniref:lecithin retinol acyltransferase family protein n=1 Tax=Caloramator sp. CAR-1 TaxID=3062777 RepID=UPI0026E37348|nr:lecithin retinol acyltransferase family protein [Caloramator sp. CAR-1]MDO6354611.1 lecithin retinol acyltransferase family protein [Caloramator sp. CAR-1]